MDRRSRKQLHARRTAQGYDCRRNYWWCRFCHRVPATDSDSLLLHILHGGFRLHGKGSIHHGQDNAQDGTARQVVHTTDNGVRMQRSCRDGNQNHREQAQPAHYDDDSSDDELLRPTTYLYNDYRNILRPGIQVGNNDLALYGWNSHVHNHEPHLQPLSHQGRGHPVRDGAATLPFPNMEGHGKTHVGERKTVSQENGRSHPRSQHNCLGLGIFSTR